MKAGFWVAPEGEDAAIALAPIEPEPLLTTRRSSFLATASAEEMIGRCRETSALLPRLVDALAVQTAGARGRLFDVTEFGPDDLKVLGEVLGEGEVAGVAILPGGVTAQIQESVMAGLWRVRFTDATGKLVADYVEVGALPEAVREASLVGGTDLAIGAPPEDAMNVMPVLAEVRDHLVNRVPGAPPHVINFSLFPMTPSDMAFLQATLGEGPVQLISRGYGYCRVFATAARGVWSVQFTNTMDTVLLDTLEICDAPEVVLAAEEDFRDSSVRLREIEEAYFK